MMKGKISKILSLVMVISMLFTTAAFAKPWSAPGQMKKFMRNKESYEKAADYVQKWDIIKGYGNGNFGYGDYVKRGDIAVMIVRAFNLSMLIDDVEDLNESFIDVVSDNYFYVPIQIAKNLGIAKGDGKHFKPKDMVTIQEAIWLIERSVNVASDKLEFHDVDLEDLFDEKELSNYAKRQDIALMLYYVLTGDDLDNKNSDKGEIPNIELTMDDNDDILNFKDSWFDKAFNKINNRDNIDYIKFILPDNSKGTLYYEYDESESKNTLVSEKYKYYLGNREDSIIENITFIPKNNFIGTLTIEYIAYDDEGESYSGLIKIIVDRDEVLKVINYNALENEYINFDKDDFSSFIDNVKFAIPNEKVGKLYFDDDSDGKPESDELISKSDVFDYEEIDDIIFVPYQDYSGEVVIKYTAYEYVKNTDEEVYSGEIKITVEAVQDIPTLKLNEDYEEEEIQIDFVDKLEDLVSNNLFDDFDYVKFDTPKKGTLQIKLEDSSRFKNIDIDKRYEIDEIEYIKYIFDDKGTVDINYTVYATDSNIDKAYEGVFRIVIE